MDIMGRDQSVGLSVCALGRRPRREAPRVTGRRQPPCQPKAAACLLPSAHTTAICDFLTKIAGGGRRMNALNHICADVGDKKGLVREYLIGIGEKSCNLLLTSKKNML